MRSNDETPARQTAQVHTWRTLVELDLSGEPGNEQLVADQVAEAVRSLDWLAAHLERLKLAVIRAALNTMERRRVVDSESAPVMRVLIPQGSLPEREADQSCAESRQPPICGWGFFLIEKTVQGPGRGEMQHLVELFLYPEGGKLGPNRR